jgi:hypothetical protein
MKKIFTILFFAVSTAIFAQNQPVFLHIKQLMNKDPFALNTATDLTATKLGQFSRLQYYISSVSILHDGGQKKELGDLVFLVNPAIDSVFLLGELPVSNVESIEFSIGVDKLYNHGDPTTFPAGHPLGVQSPDMQWGWASGYRFVALEGDADGIAGPLKDHFEVHALGDNNYFPQQILTPATPESDGIHLRIKADYVRLLDNIELNGGFVAHSISGKAIVLLKNMRDFVFSSDQTLGICCDNLNAQFSVSPNPTMRSANVVYNFSAIPASAIQYRVFDENGRVVFSEKLNEKVGNILIDLNGPNGLYFVEFSTIEGQILQTQRVIKY